MKLNKAGQPSDKRADRVRDAEADIAPGILTILDALPFYVLLIDEDHHILLANKAVRDQLQVSPEEILGQYCPQAIHGFKGPFPGCPLEEAVAAGVGVERELYDERNGRWVNSAVYSTGLKTRNNKGVFFHMTFDITDRKLAEERHKEPEQRFKAIFNSASDGIVLADTKSQQFYIGNKMMSRMLDYSQEEIKKLVVMDIHPRQDLPYVIEQFEKQARNEKTLAEDIPVKRKDGSVFYADISSAPIILGGRAYLLGREGYKVETSYARQALEKLSTERYRLILMDIMMPRMDG
jgi:PAS domain S-box-containing protein